MPTTLKRTQITHTEPVTKWLSWAAEAWPENAHSDRALLLHLLAAGGRAARQEMLIKQYEEADREWYESGEAAVWECTAGDGIEDEE